MKGLTNIGRKRPVDIKKRVAVTKGKVGGPARIPDAVLNSPVKLVQKIDRVARVMRPPKITRLQQRTDHRQAE